MCQSEFTSRKGRYELAKEEIAYDDLLKKIQDLLSASPECHDIHVDGIDVYRETIDGANWDITTFRCSGSDNDIVECRDTIRAQILELREAFDVVK